MLCTDPVEEGVDINMAFVHQPVERREFWELGCCGRVGGVEQWMLPLFRARILYCFRVALSVSLACAWVFAPPTRPLFPPSILIPLAAVSPPPLLGTRCHHDAHTHALRHTLARSHCCVPTVQILCCAPTLGASIGALTHFMLGACYGALFSYVYSVCVPLQWGATAAAIAVFTFIIVYANQPPLATKVSYTHT